MEKVPQSLVTSVVCTLPSKIKCYILYAKKNRILAERLLPLYSVITEQLVPQFVAKNIDSYTVVNQIQHLVFLMALKVQQAFQSSVVRSCLDQNLALKALKQVTLRLLEKIQVTQSEKFQQIMDTQIAKQNELSSICITEFISYIKDPCKNLQEEDLCELIETFETTLHYVVKDIDRHRKQHTPVACFMTLYPWAYDIDLVDMQIIMNNDLTNVVAGYLKRDAQVFWLSYFKCQAAVTSDEFFSALREMCNLAHMNEFFVEQQYLYEQIATQHSVISLRENADLVSNLIRAVSRGVGCGTKLNILVGQIKTHPNEHVPTDLITCELYQLQSTPDLEAFKSHLTGAKMLEYNQSQIDSKNDLAQQPFKVTSQKSDHENCLKVTVIHADTPCNKNAKYFFDGNEQTIFKFGEGDIADYQLPNDKKLWESQLQFVCDKDGNYFARDCGRLHPSKVRLDMKHQVQLQQGSIVDLGNYLQYHFDKVTQELPFQKPNDTLIFRPQCRNEEPEDLPFVRARALWLNKISIEDQDQFQKELIIEANQPQQMFKIGRGSKNDIPIKLSKLSTEHCSIRYRGNQGWQITEAENSRPSHQGTFVYMKSLQQIMEQEPSNLIPVYDGMVLSFINYELRLELRPVAESHDTIDQVQLLPLLLKKEAVRLQQGLFKHLLAKAAAAKLAQKRADSSISSQKSIKTVTRVVRRSKTKESPKLDIVVEDSPTKKSKTIRKKVVEKPQTPQNGGTIINSQQSGARSVTQSVQKVVKQDSVQSISQVLSATKSIKERSEVKIQSESKTNTKIQIKSTQSKAQISVAILETKTQSEPQMITESVVLQNSQISEPVAQVQSTNQLSKLLKQSISARASEVSKQLQNHKAIIQSNKSELQPQTFIQPEVPKVLPQKSEVKFEPSTAKLSENKSEPKTPSVKQNLGLLAMHVRKDTECNQSEPKPQSDHRSDAKISEVKSDPKIASLKSDPKIASVKSDPKIASVKSDPKIASVNSGSKTASVKSDPKIITKSNKSEHKVPSLNLSDTHISEAQLQHQGSDQKIPSIKSTQTIPKASETHSNKVSELKSEEHKNALIESQNESAKPLTSVQSSKHKSQVQSCKPLSQSSKPQIQSQSPDFQEKASQLLSKQSDHTAEVQSIHLNTQSELATTSRDQLDLEDEILNEAQDSEEFEEEEIEEEMEEEIDELDEDELAQLENDIDLDNLDLDEIQSMMDQADNMSQDDDEPVMVLPKMDAIRADRQQATRLMLIENTFHTIQCDQMDQYSLKSSLCFSELRAQTIQREQEAAEQVERMKSKLTEALRKKMDIHNLKAQEYSKLESSIAQGAEDLDPILIQQELQESESLMMIKQQLQEAEVACQIAKEMKQTMGIVEEPQTEEVEEPEEQVHVMVEVGLQTHYRGHKSNENCDMKQSNSTALKSQKISLAGRSLSKANNNLMDKSKSSWLDTDTLYSQKFLVNTHRIVFPKEDEKLGADSD